MCMLLSCNAAAVAPTSSCLLNQLISQQGSEREAGNGDVVVVSHSKGRAVGKNMYEYKKGHPSPLANLAEDRAVAALFQGQRG